MTSIVSSFWIILCAPILLFFFINFDEQMRFNYSITVQILTPILSAALCYSAARVFPKGDAMRKVWGYLGSGMLAWGIGAILFALYPLLNNGQETPYPWYSDFGYLLMVPLTLAALIIFNQYLHIKIPAWGVLLGTVAFGIALALAIWLNLNKLSDSTSLSDYTVTLLYVVGDPLLLGVTILVASILGGGAAARPWWLVLTGLVLYYAADLLYTYLVLQEQYSTGNPIDIGWALGFGFIAIAAMMTRGLFEES